MRIALLACALVATVAGASCRAIPPATPRAARPAAPSPTPAPAPALRASATPAAPPEAGSSATRPEDTAGLYWVPYETCEDCAAPAAIVAYIAATPRAAQAIVRTLTGRLPLGLPYVVHTDEIGVHPRGIAVVTGAYGSLAAARAARAKLTAIAGVAPRVIEPLQAESSDDALEVTVVDRGDSVPAWSQADVAAVTQALDDTTDPAAHETDEGQHAWFWSHLRARKPACRVQPGDLFVVRRSYDHVYELAPVQCGGKPAYIEWTKSLLGHAVIVRSATGARLYQVIGAQCDMPDIRMWTYDAEGRHAP